MVTILAVAFLITLAIAFSDFLLVMGMVAALLTAIVWVWVTFHSTTLAGFWTFLEGCEIVAGMVVLAWGILAISEKLKGKSNIIAPPAH